MAEALGAANHQKRRTYNNNNNAEKEKNTATLSKISNAIKGSEKLDVEGADLLDLLSHLEGELQARDIAIAALKSEQIKRVLYGCYMGRGRPDSPLAALQRDKTTVSDAGQVEEGVRQATSAAEVQIAALHEVVEKQRVAAKRMAEFLRESERQRGRLLLELEEERAKHERDTAQGDDITYELEKERIRLRQELEAAAVDKQRLETAVKDVTGRLEEEKARQKQIVLVLLSDRKKLHKLYLEEKKRSEDLAQILQEEKSKMETMAVGLEEESKRSLAMEAELEKHLSQFGSERQQLREKLVADERRTRDLEEALRKARVDVEHFKKQLAEAHRVAMSQAAPPPPYPGTAAGSGNVTSVSPTPISVLNRAQQQQQPLSQQPPYVASYSNYSTYGQLASGGAGGQGSASGITSASISSGGVISQQASYQTSNQGPATSGTTRSTIGTTAGNLGRGSSAMTVGSNPVARSLSGGMPVSAALVGAQQGTASGGQQVTHNIRHHSTNFNNAASGFHASHPALIPAGAALSHLDPEVSPSDIYSQINKQPMGSVGSKTGGAISTTAAANRKLADTTSTSAPASRKPGLGKGVPPPVPPNKPVVPVKKDMSGGGGKRTTSEMKDITLSLVEGGNKQQQSSAAPVPTPSMVTGLQGLKFGISIGSVVDAAGGSGKVIKPLGGGAADVVPVLGGGAVAAKKFFNNIESKS